MSPTHEPLSCAPEHAGNPDECGGGGDDGGGGVGGGCPLESSQRRDVVLGVKEARPHDTT